MDKLLRTTIKAQMLKALAFCVNRVSCFFNRASMLGQGSSYPANRLYNRIIGCVLCHGADG